MGPAKNHSRQRSRKGESGYRDKARRVERSLELFVFYGEMKWEYAYIGSDTPQTTLHIFPRPDLASQKLLDHIALKNRLGHNAVDVPGLDTAVPDAQSRQRMRTTGYCHGIWGCVYHDIPRKAVPTHMARHANTSRCHASPMFPRFLGGVILPVQLINMALKRL